MEKPGQVNILRRQNAKHQITIGAYGRNRGRLIGGREGIAVYIIGDQKRGIGAINADIGIYVVQGDYIVVAHRQRLISWDFDRGPGHKILDEVQSFPPYQRQGEAGHRRSKSDVPQLGELGAVINRRRG